MRKSLFAVMMLWGGSVLVADGAPPPPTVDDAEEEAAVPRVNPDGVTTKRELGGTVEEFRIGGRLESMKVDRDRGSTDYWYDRRGDSTWQPGTGEVGETRNTRQWQIGNW